MKIITVILFLLAMAGCTTTTHNGVAIRDRLSDNRDLAAHNISINEERAGIITLNGEVSSDKDRATIERIARDTRGVKVVRNNLVVNPSFVAVREGATLSSSSSNEQRAIATDITARMSSARELSNYNLNVSVVDNEVVLRGEVASENERNVAENIARNTRGVTGVRNEIIVARSDRSDLQLSQNVRHALNRRNDIDLRNVNISARDAIVTLRGSQTSNREIDNLISSTRMVPGVRDVRNELTLVDRRYYDRY